MCCLLYHKFKMSECARNYLRIQERENFRSTGGMSPLQVLIVSYCPMKPKHVHYSNIWVLLLGRFRPKEIVQVSPDIWIENFSADNMLTSRIKSIAIANMPNKCTPAFSIRRFASAASLSVKVPLASVLAQTEYPASRRLSARNEVPISRVSEKSGEFLKYMELKGNVLQTSVTIPARITCFLPVASTAFRKSGLSQASTSPWRRMKGAVGCMLIISFGRAPLGPSQKHETLVKVLLRLFLPNFCGFGYPKFSNLPCSADDVRIVGRLNRLPSAAWARILFLNSTTP